MTNNLQVDNTTNKLVHTVFNDLVCNAKNENFVFSPSSYLEALHNLLLCTNGENLNQILDVLGIDKTNIIEYISKYKQTLNDLETYNTILYDKKFTDYLDKNCFNLLENFDVNSESFSDLPSLVSRINEIVKEKTHGKITNLISLNDVNSLTAFAILNCVYFKKSWLQDFDRRYNEQSFFGSNLEVKTKFLFNQVKHNYYEDDILDIVELPYKDSDICCYLFVPNKNHSIFDITNDWNNSYNKINFLKKDLPVNIAVPEFKIEYKMSLVESTKLAGITNIFNWNQDWNLIDWNKMKSEAVLVVQDIIQKAYFRFDQKGTEAAASTVMMLTCSGYCPGPSIPIEIKYVCADKPFIFALANKNNKDVPLFVGQVKNL